MATCVIKKFSIGGIPLIIEKSSKLPTNDNPDKLFNYSVTDCSLTKEMLKPNEFTFTLRRDTITKTDDSKHFTIVNYLIGKNVKCVVDTILDGHVTSTLNFEGSIAAVSMKGLNVTCVANSADANLQGLPKCRCFTEKSLYSIVKTIVPKDIKVDVHSCFNDLVFPYMVQYNESDYDFLVRLAKRFGAFFYYCYDSQASMNYLVFGKLPNAATIEIQAPNSAAASYELQTGDPNFKFASHYYEKNMDLESGGVIFDYFNPQKLFKMAVKGSTEPDRNYPFFIDNPCGLPKDPSITLLDDYNLVMMCSNNGNMATCKFICYLFDLEVGNIVKINDNGLMVVTSVKLTWDCNGSPQNEVTAMLLPNDTVDLDAIFAPYLDFNVYPKSSAQRAEVINNVDPLKMGRVQVQFVWQKNASDDEKKNFPWIRIAQPYGGNQKGCYVLPEIGEEVMVGFEHENMEKPFVIGTLYHDADAEAQIQMPDNTWCEVKDGEKANEENEVKAFRTKKGHTIEFHDVAGDNQYGFIRIYGNEKKDQPNYDIILSTDPVKPEGNNGENYKVTSASAKKDEGFEDYEAKELRIMVRSNGGDIMLDAGMGDIIMHAANIRLHATGDRTAYIEGNDIVKVKQEQDITVNLSNLQVDDSRYVIVKDEDYLQSKKLNFDINEEVLLSAKSLSMETSGKTEIKASDIAAEAHNTAELKAKTGLELDGGSQADLKAANVTVNGQTKTEIKGADIDLQGATSISATSAKIKLTSPSGALEGAWRWP